MKKTKKSRRFARKKTRNQRGGLKKLIEAVENGNIAKVEDIIRRLNASYNNDKKALARAINKKERVENDRGDYDINAIRAAIGHHNIEIALLLLMNGAIIEERDYIDLLMTAINSSNKKGAIDIIEEFKKKFGGASLKRLINEKYEGGLTPLDNIIREIMNYGITKHNTTTMSDIIVTLIENGAIIKQALPWTRIPEEELQEIIRSNERRITRIWQIAIAAENIDLVRLLIEGNYRVDENKLLYAIDSYKNDDENVDAMEIIRLITNKLIEKGIIPQALGEDKTSWFEFLKTGSRRKPLEVSGKEIQIVQEGDVSPYRNEDDVNLEYDSDDDNTPGAYQREGVVGREMLPDVPIAEPIEHDDHNDDDDDADNELKEKVYIYDPPDRYPVQKARYLGGKKVTRKRRSNFSKRRQKR